MTSVLITGGGPTGMRAAEIASATDAIVQFVPDIPGNYQLALKAKDRFGNVTPNNFTNVNTTQCGANPLAVAVYTPVNGNLQPLVTSSSSPWTLPQGKSLAMLARASSSDNDPAQCPARFAQTLSYTWTIVTRPVNGDAQLSDVSGATSVFQSGSDPNYLAYELQLVVHGSNGQTSAPFSVFIQVVLPIAP